jgi:hypothetical protein
LNSALGRFSKSGYEAESDTTGRGFHKIDNPHHVDLNSSLGRFSKSGYEAESDTTGRGLHKIDNPHHIDLHLQIYTLGCWTSLRYFMFTENIQAHEAF